jgi:hypothetical protein
LGKCYVEGEKRGTKVKGDGEEKSQDLMEVRYAESAICFTGNWRNRTLKENLIRRL